MHYWENDLKGIGITCKTSSLTFCRKPLYFVYSSQLVLRCTLYSFFLLHGHLLELEHFWNNFIPKRHFICPESTLHPRFQIDDEIFLLLFGKLWPRDWRRTRIGWIRRPGIKQNNAQLKLHQVPSKILLINNKQFFSLPLFFAIVRDERSAAKGSIALDVAVTTKNW